MPSYRPKKQQMYSGALIRAAPRKPSYLSCLVVLLSNLGVMGYLVDVHATEFPATDHDSFLSDLRHSRDHG
jgi:hypothetical protein